MLVNKRLIAVIFSVTVFSLTYGLSSPLIAFKLLNAGMSESAIGVNAAMHAVGVFLIAPFLPALFRRYRPLTLIVVSLCAITVIFMLFGVVSFPMWFLLRMGLGLFSEIIMVQTETWLNGSTVERARGKVLALYTAGMSLGFATGPLILAWTGSDGNLAFYVASVLAALAIVFIFTSGMPRVEGHEEKPETLGNSLKLAALPIMATVLNAAVEVLGMNFLSLYAIKLGWSESASALLISVLMFGAILLQLPIGWLADRVDRLKLMTTLAFIAAALAFVWPHILAFHLLSYVMLFIWGGIFVGIYTVAITWVGERFKGGQLAGIYAAMSVAWGAGALAGPLLGGFAMTFSLHGLPWLTGALCLVFALLSLSGPLRSRS
ncbi:MULTISPECIES: MFS transporter [Lelliottia]|uniref:MFS transporter n=1 Tax=Lelliottia TaxID=1330545 RepID=UPI000743B713|nr:MULTISPECIES: MFS transporter [Lelliottia]ATG00169.1 MFS transporter [Lelliottia amnigena]MCU7785925.1 MFS transporter [Lelliottia amnigena]MCU7785964.1 MFS transporter [Lelliottia amnigena]PEG65160.1 MFS transporter [Lelliottia amnigena]QXA20487.1 MFS transporter [Lelliottia amnigena]